jgi:hypothetical protein
MGEGPEGAKHNTVVSAGAKPRQIAVVGRAATKA